MKIYIIYQEQIKQIIQKNKIKYAYDTLTNINKKSLYDNFMNFYTNENNNKTNKDKIDIINKIIENIIKTL